MDEQVGRLFAAMPANTLFLFTSDNGAVFSASNPGEEAPQMSGHHRAGSNGPFRGGKNMVYEGGIRVPLIAHWPNHIAPSTVNSSILGSIDLLPTFLSLVGKLPDLSWDGEDMSQAFLGQQVVRQKPLFFEYRYGSHSPIMAVRKGNYKLLANLDMERVELYDLSTNTGMREVDQVVNEEVRTELLTELFEWRWGLRDSPVDPEAGLLNWEFPDYSEVD